MAGLWRCFTCWPWPPQDVEPGSSIKPQLATRASTVEDCFRRMAGRPFVVEAKWDGIRIQCHLEPGRVLYVSRRGVEHGEHTDYNVMDAAVRAQVGGGWWVGVGVRAQTGAYVRACVQSLMVQAGLCRRACACVGYDAGSWRLTVECLRLQVNSPRCILDGEMIVWNKAR